MTKAEFISKVQNSLQTELKKKTVAEVIDAVFDALKDTLLKEGKFNYPGFGIFTVKERKARKGINPRTKKPMTIPASKTITFKPSAALKKELNK